MVLMRCGKDKATKLLELDKDDIGTIERKKQGQGRPTRIYVKNFIMSPDPSQPQQPEPTPQPHDRQTAENQRSAPLEPHSFDGGFSA